MLIIALKVDVKKDQSKVTIIDEDSGEYEEFKGNIKAAERFIRMFKSQIVTERPKLGGKKYDK